MFNNELSMDVAEDNLNSHSVNESQNNINIEKRYLKDEFNKIKLDDLSYNSHKAYIVELTQEGIVYASTLTKSKKRKVEGEYIETSKTHFCLLCFNSNKKLHECFLYISKNSTGNITKHLLTHELTKDDLKAKSKFDLLSNIGDLDHYINKLTTSASSNSLSSPEISSSYYSPYSTKFNEHKIEKLKNLLSSLECQLGLAFGSFNCDTFKEFLYEYHPNPDLEKVIPNARSSKKHIEKVFHNEKENLKKEIMNTIDIITKENGKFAVSLQHLWMYMMSIIGKLKKNIFLTQIKIHSRLNSWIKRLK